MNMNMNMNNNKQMSTMRVLNLSTVVCAECGKEMMPQQNTRVGTTVIDEYAGNVDFIEYWHTASSVCPYSELIVLVPKPAAVEVKVVGRLDWTRSPKTIVKPVPRVG